MIVLQKKCWVEIHVIRIWNSYKTNLFCLLSLILYITVTSGCATQKAITAKEGNEPRQKPNWLIHGKHLDFPSPRYIQGIGMVRAGKNPALDKQTADQNALSEIIRQISTTISSEFSLSENASIKNNTENIVLNITSKSKSKSSLTVNGLTIVDRFYDPDEKVYYSIGILDRISASEPHRQTLLQHLKDYREHLQSAIKHRETGEIFQFLLSLREALHASYKFEETLPYFQLLAGQNVLNESDFNDPPSPVVILNTLSETLSHLNINIIDGNQQEFIVGKSLSTPLTVRLTLDDKMPAIQAEGFPILFRFKTGRGELIPDITRTNKEGIASTLVTKIERSPDQEYVIAAEVDLNELLDMSNYGAAWNNRIPQDPIVRLFTVKRKKAPNSEKVLVLIQDSGTFHGKSSIVRDIIVKHLSEVGFSPITESEIDSSNSYLVIDAIQKMRWKSIRQQFPTNIKFLISGEISITDFNNAYGLTTCSVNGLIKVISLDDGLTITAKSFQNIRGVGTTESQAADAAFKNAAMEVSETLMGDLLSKYEAMKIR